MRKTVLTLVLAAICMLAAARPVKYDLKGQFPAALNGKKVVVYAIANDRTPVDWRTVQSVLPTMATSCLQKAVSVRLPWLSTTAL